MTDLPWDLDTLTIAEAEALFAQPVPSQPWTDDPQPFCEDELLAVYRRHLKHARDQLQECADVLQALHGPATGDERDRRLWDDEEAHAVFVDACDTIDSTAPVDADGLSGTAEDDPSAQGRSPQKS